jgi:hypothetical protein
MMMVFYRLAGLIGLDRYLCCRGTLKLTTTISQVSDRSAYPAEPAILPTAQTKARTDKLRTADCKRNLCSSRKAGFIVLVAWVAEKCGFSNLPKRVRPVLKLYCVLGDTVMLPF